MAKLATVFFLAALSVAFCEEGGRSIVLSDVRYDAPKEGTRAVGRGWKVSAAAVLAASAFDCQSSWGRLELNPLLRGSDGRFGAKGAGIKLGITAGSLFLEYALARKLPKAEKVGVVTNGLMAGVLTSVAVYNKKLAAQERAGK